MHRASYIFLAIFSFLLTASCSQPKSQVFSDHFFTFGTDISVSIFTHDKDLAAKGFTAIRSKFKELNSKLHPWNPGELNSLNRAIAASKKIQISPFLINLIQAGQRFNTQSAGLFDPAIGSLVKLWKFDQAANIHTSIPSASEIANITSQRPSIADVVIDPNGYIHCENDLVRLDFGGFAKGYAADSAIKILEDLGISNAIVNAGGDLKSIGNKDGTAWMIGIRDPFSNSAIASVAINSKLSVFTSGNYERFFKKDGKTFHHIINPETGFPTTLMASVTVIHDSGILADAAATALFVAGPDRWQQIAKSLGVNKVMLITSKKEIILTPEMDKQLTILDTTFKKTVKGIN